MWANLNCCAALTPTVQGYTGSTMSHQRQIPLFFRAVQFRHDGKPCPVRGCGALVGVTWIANGGRDFVADDEGPQGSWRCPAGHSAWFYPKDCTKMEHK